MVVERWTDEMLDVLASSVSESRRETSELRESIAESRRETSELRESIAESRKNIAESRRETSELRESVVDLRESVNSLDITSRALLQLAAQQQQRSRELDEKHAQLEEKYAKLEEEKVENNKRFNVLLEEVRFLIRSQNQNPNNES